jgi:hypothetical protein
VALTKDQIKDAWLLEQLKKLRGTSSAARVKARVERLAAQAETVAAQADEVLNPPVE